MTQLQTSNLKCIKFHAASFSLWWLNSQETLLQVNNNCFQTKVNLKKMQYFFRKALDQNKDSCDDSIIIHHITTHAYIYWSCRLIKCCIQVVMDCNVLILIILRLALVGSPWHIFAGNVSPLGIKLIIINKQTQNLIMHAFIQ